MAEHVHEWVPRVLDWEDIDGARCADVLNCDAQIDNAEMSRRLNATERLSAEEASRLSDDLQIVKMFTPFDGEEEAITIDKMTATLKAYADTLEGK